MNQGSLVIFFSSVRKIFTFVTRHAETLSTLGQVIGPRYRSKTYSTFIPLLRGREF